MWIKLGLNQNSSSTNEKLADLETDWLGDWPGDLTKRLLRGYTFFKFLWGRVVRRWWVDAQCPQMSFDILGTSCDQCQSTKHGSVKAQFNKSHIRKVYACAAARSWSCRPASNRACKRSQTHGWGTMMMSWCLMSSDVIWHIRDKLWSMPKHGSVKSTYVRCMRV